METKITIFTPTYNRAHTLRRTFESLKNQTIRDFKWLIIDDGSTDNTKDLVENFKQNADFEIEYHYQENAHKFVSIIRGVKLCNTEYFTILDSDDAILPNALEILLDEIENVPDDIVFVCGLAVDENGQLIGEEYPKSPLDCSIFEMRYHYKVKGDKWGLGFTKVFRNMNLQEEKYLGKGFIPEGVYQFLFDVQGKHRFINKAVRVYHRDLEDEHSLANNFYDAKNAFGLSQSYLTFINVYADKIFSYPKTLLRNLIGYQYYSLKDNTSFSKIISNPQNIAIKLLGLLTLPLSFIYHKLK